MENFRIGHGYDVHALGEGLDFFIGGIQIPHYKGSIAHSDGDALIHAICDALLGAAALGDIGLHFPDNSEEFKNIDSKILLDKTVKLIKEKGYKIGNIDCTLALEQPKVKPYINQMRQALAPIMDLELDAISIKATTTEKLGFIGRQEGIEATAVVLIYKP